MSRTEKYKKLLAKFDEMKEILAATPDFSPDWDIQTRLNHIRQKVEGRIVIERGVAIQSAKPAPAVKLPPISHEEYRATLAKQKKEDLLAMVAELNKNAPGTITGFEGANKELLVMAILSSLYPKSDGKPPAGAEIIK